MRQPPQVFLKFFRWYCHPKLKAYIEGDLIEMYNERVQKSKLRADISFAVDVILLCRPSIIRPTEGYQNINHYGMFKNYFKTALRNLRSNAVYSFINIGGLALGMTVAMFIGLWVYDELSFNKYHDNYDSIAQLWHGGLNQEGTEIEGGHAMQYAVITTLKSDYSRYFKHIVRSTWQGDHTVSTGKENFSRSGLFMDPGGLDMLSIKMIKGNYRSLDNQNSIILSESGAAAIFGTEDPINKTLRIANEMDVQVTGIYEDIPRNDAFKSVDFFAPWELWVSTHQWIKRAETDWDNTQFAAYVQLQPNVTFEEVNAAIHDMFKKHVPADFYAMIARYAPFVSVVPMNKWHLYTEFKDGIPIGGRITFVWLFGIVGAFVLLLACINFVNLSTARSEKRAKEVGVRKTMGSAKGQLVFQFLGESFLVVILAFILSVILLALLQPSFNELADKDIHLPFTNAYFWLIVAGFIAFTGFAAGTYPALYLSSFHPVKVLKGSFRFGRFAALPRKILVVVQFTVSVILIIGTIVVYEQVQYARNRPVGYSREGLISIRINDPQVRKNLQVLRTELINSGITSITSLSSNSFAGIYNGTSGYNWPGKDPNIEGEFSMGFVTPDYGRTVNWKVVDGRDFSSDIASDTIDAIIINRAAAKYMGLEKPVGQQLIDTNTDGTIRWVKTIIGVVEDVVLTSPYEPVSHTIYFYRPEMFSYINMRIDPNVSVSDAISKAKSIFSDIVPTAYFEYAFADETYKLKFAQEERIGKLAGVFAVLAIVISCLGLFALSSFVAEQRTKEIGIRKVMGASVSTLWRMLSKDFVVLVIIACVVAVPVGYYSMNLWLENFKYHTEISLWVFVTTVGSAITITLITVSYQSLRAAAMDPVKSLRSE